MTALRRIALIATLSVALVAAGGSIVVAETAAKAPSGFKTIKVKKASFSIAVPKDWSVLDVTRQNVDTILDTLRQRAPELANQLPPNAAALAAQNIVLLAYDDEAVSGFTAKLNVLLIPDLTEDPTIADIEPQIASIAPDADFSQVKISGRNAVKAEYDLFSGSIEAHLVQYLVVGERGGLTITFTTSIDNPLKSDFNKMAKSIKLLK